MDINKYHADRMVERAALRLQSAQDRKQKTWSPCKRRRLSAHIFVLGTTLKTRKATAEKIGLLALFAMAQMTAQRLIFTVPKRWQWEKIQEGQQESQRVPSVTLGQPQQLHQVPQVPRERG